MVDRVKVATFMGTDRPHVLRQAIHCCRNFGTVSRHRRLWRLPRQDPDGLGDQSRPDLPHGADTGTTLSAEAAETIERQDRSLLRDHTSRRLDEGPELYKTFRDKQDGCIKVVMKPN